MTRPTPEIRISTTQVMHKARAFKSLRWQLLATRAGMVLERSTRGFWPFWSWLFVIWTALSFGQFGWMSVEIAYFAVLAATVGAVGFLVQGLRRFRWPGLDEAADRLDRSLAGRPLTALWDRQAIGAGDIESTLVWQAHVQRMAEQAATARAVPPDLRISDRDPFGLRYVAATGLVIAVLFGTVDRRTGLGDVLAPDVQGAFGSGPVFEGWIEPPRYTGIPAIYLNEIAGTEPLPIPEGSKVTIRLYGQTGTITFSETVSGKESDVPSDEGTTELDFTVRQSGTLNALGRSGAGTEWQIDMIPDDAPMIAVSGPVERSPRGETMLSFQASDDYRVVAGTGVLTLDLAAVDRRYGLKADPEPQADIAFDIPLPFNGDTTDFSDTIVEDFSKHPWASLPVLLKLTASDDVEQVAYAEPETFLLPGRRFFDPLAAALIEQRRDLLWNRLNSKRVAQVLRAISNLPEDIFHSDSAYLILRTAIRRLEYNAQPEVSASVRDDVAELLWRTALLIEDGDLSDAEERLKRAQDRLSEALENGATDEELAELMDELSRAMQDYLEQLAREADQNPDQEQAQSGEMREITSDQLQQMLDRIQEMFKEGRTEEAQQMLEKFRQMMENMQTARRQQGQGQGQGQQSMRELQDTLRQQQELSDDAFRQMQRDFNGQRPNSSNPGMAQSENANPENAMPGPQELARRQEALRELLESQRRGLPDSNTEEGRAAREALRRAEREMGAARGSLDGNDLPKALDEQANALEALREGLENLGQDMARDQNSAEGRQGDQAGSPDPNSRRDPLGRQAGSVGRLGSEETLLPGDDPFMRSRELLDEIRRRSGEKRRPRLELEYLERLLDRF